MNYLYNNLDARYNKYLYVNGFSYSMKLNSSLLLQYKESDLILSIINKHWDIIIYGRVGIDEDREGSLPNLPYWKIVNRFYLKEQIAFIYGGDHNINISNGNDNNKYYTKAIARCRYTNRYTILVGHPPGKSMSDWRAVTTTPAILGWLTGRRRGVGHLGPRTASSHRR